MSVKPEFSIRQIKESYKTLNFEVPKGAFVGRLYWSDFSKYIPTGVKLEGCQRISDNKKNYHRICEFVITNYETAQFLISQCAPSNKFFIVNQTKTALSQMEVWFKTGTQMIKAASKVVQSKVVKTVKTAVSVVQNLVRRPFQYQPQSFAKCETIEQAVYLFNRCPEGQMKEGFINNFYSTIARICPKTDLFGNIWDESSDTSQIGLSLDDIVEINYVPGELQLDAMEVEHIPAGEVQVRQMMADGINSNKARRKQWIIGVGKSIPGFQVIVKGTDKRNAETILQQVIKNILLAGLTVSQLRDIIAAS